MKTLPLIKDKHDPALRHVLKILRTPPPADLVAGGSVLSASMLILCLFLAFLVIFFSPKLHVTESNNQIKVQFQDAVARSIGGVL